MRNFLIVFVLIFVFEQNLCDQDKSYVVTSTEPSVNKEKYNANSSGQINPRISSIEIVSNISNRFASTLVTSKVLNSRAKAAETTFSVILPKDAFISDFSMEIDGKIYKAFVKERSEAAKIYKNAKFHGKSAGKVETNTRDSNTFTISVNIEPQSKTIFRLYYEELLQRELGRYELLLNINPGQIVDDLNVRVNIAESRPLKFVKTPLLRTGNEISTVQDENLNPHSQIEIINKTSARVAFKPDKERQKEIAESLKVGDSNLGIQGQFVVQYDVERDQEGGEVLIKDGYFVHFFAPSNLETIPKHVVFVLDHSGSMSGRKIEQLIDAMQNILSELGSEDVFNMVRFADVASVWDINQNIFQNISIENPVYGNLYPILDSMYIPSAVEANQANINSAKEIIRDQSNLGATNIIAGLEVAIFLLKKYRETSNKMYQPMIFFLTDGRANEGLYDANEIIETVGRLNSGTDRASMFCLSFGAHADKNFLQRLCLDNLGFSRHIYEAADASIQLENFYKKISSPLLRNVTFKYVDGVSAVTRDYHPILFSGSELVVAGKTDEELENISLAVNAINKEGKVVHLRPLVEKPVSKLERLWSYLTVKQLLEKAKSNPKESAELKQKALDLALKYSFVTEVSSLVVVRPDKNSTALNPEEDSSREKGRSRGRSRIRSRPRKPYADDAIDSSIIRVKPLTIEEKIRKHIEVLTNNTERLRTPQGSFKFGKSGDVKVYPDCPRTPLNGTGECKILYDCPYYFTLLKDLNVILTYFCPLENKYVGVCCPKGKVN